MAGHWLVDVVSGASAMQSSTRTRCTVHDFSYYLPKLPEKLQDSVGLNCKVNLSKVRSGDVARRQGWFRLSGLLWASPPQSPQPEELNVTLEWWTGVGKSTGGLAFKQTCVFIRAGL